MDQSQEEFDNFVSHLIDKFNPETMNFLEWLNLFEFTMDLLHTTEKNVYLLNMLDFSPYNYIWTRVNPVDPLEIPYEILVSMLQEKYSPYDAYYSAYVRLKYRFQILGESVEHYYETIKKLTYKWNCGPQVNSILLIIFVSGLRSQETRTMLQTIPNLTLETALFIAKYMENIEKPIIYI